MTRAEIIGRLRAAGIEDPEKESLLLISEFCAKSPEAILADRAADYQNPALDKALARREKREPLQYVLGKWPFCNETYLVTPACLIPRPETELLVRYAAEKLPRDACFADLGTGSGCIAISILARRPDCTAVALDISREALAVAAKNAAKNGVAERIRFCRWDLLGDTPFAPDRPFDAILSNPPYIKSGDLPALPPELAYEPAQALDGGSDGMRFYRRILHGWAAHLKPDGFFLFETGWDTAQGVRELAESIGFRCTLTADLSGIPRMAVVERL